MTSDLNKNIQELQILEQSLQSVLMQKQQIQVELSEAENAYSEVSKSSGEIFKIFGGIMLKSEKSQILKELDEKKNLSGLRIQAIERQEDLINSKISQLRKSISLSQNKNNYSE